MMYYAIIFPKITLHLKFRTVKFSWCQNKGQIFYSACILTEYLLLNKYFQNIIWSVIYSSVRTISVLEVKMPLHIFGNSFTPRKSVPRKSKLPASIESCPNRIRTLGLGLDIDEIKMKLGSVTSTFQDGTWVHGRLGIKNVIVSVANSLIQVNYN